MKTRKLLILAVAVLCTPHVYSQTGEIVAKTFETGVEVVAKTGLEVAVPTLEKGAANVFGAGIVSSAGSLNISVPTLEIPTATFVTPQNTIPTTSIIPVTDVVSHSPIPTGMPSYSYGDVLVQVGNFNLFHNNHWYWVQPGAGAEIVPQPTKIIFPSQRMASPDFANYLKEKGISIDPAKTSRYDSYILATEKFNTFGFKLRNRIFPKGSSLWKWNLHLK